MVTPALAVRSQLRVPRSPARLGSVCAAPRAAATGVSAASKAPPGADAEAPPERVPLLAPSDVGKAVAILGLGSLSWLLPERRWPGACRSLARVLGGPPGGGRRIAGLLAGQGFYGEPDAIYRAAQAECLVSYMQVLREYRPGGWRPTCNVEGSKHVDRALERGEGVVLWLPLFSAYSFAAKVAMQGAGIDASHVSHRRHGFSHTRLGARLLNPIRTRAEDRYLSGRLMLSETASVAGLREALACLRQNEIVSITAGGAGRHATIAPFLGAELGIANGGPALAYTAGARLLFVFPVRNSSGGVSVFIEDCVSLEATERRREFVRRAALSFAARLEHYVRRYPAQWRGWAD